VSAERVGYQPRGRFVMSEGLDVYFDSYRRVALDGVGHFPPREAPDQVTALVREHLTATGA
jgi:pimeloyl-ACP methyl ester carboxylesterase